MPKAKPYLNFMVEQEMLDAVDEFRFKHKFPSRADALKFLLQAALDAGLKPEKN